MKNEELASSNFDNLGLIESLYESYRKNPASVDPSWKKYFAHFESPIPVAEAASAEQRILPLVQAYRLFGYLFAKVNPIAIGPIEEPWQLHLSTHGFSPEELEKSFPTLSLLPQSTAPLKEIIAALRKIYCSHIGVEYSGLQNPVAKQWMQHEMETTHKELSIEEKKMILQQLNKSGLLEHFLHTKYTAQKRFSLEGCETLIPMLSAIFDKGAEMHVQEFILGMAHRGRLNILANILNKSYTDIFSEFEKNYIPPSSEGSGDVKYHKGYQAAIKTEAGRPIKIILMPNPSHLEAVGPVASGFSRARQIQLNDLECSKVMPILIHGDAALSGQGVVYENLQFINLKGYRTGGTFHIVINNQIGFTTIPKDSRSTLFCTDIAHAFNAPVFHVNAEDPEACLFAARLAIEMRYRFHCDVFIDLNCYRKYGHNETDEPAFTQPVEYQIIKEKQPIRELYRDALIKQGVVEKQLAETLETEFKNSLHAAQMQILKPQKAKLEEEHPEAPLFSSIKTGVAQEKLTALTEKLCEVPEGFTVHPKLKKLIDYRFAMGHGQQSIDWGMSEMLTYATLLSEGKHVRLTGQDSCRGTFSHRHGVWIDQQSDRVYCPLQHLSSEQGRFDLFNSPLSEYASMGFEYGYSVASLDGLTIWEAQFGDFCNGGQVVIDQFISCGQQKWNQKNNLVLFLPHGYEGQGPEHSSARIERFLSLAAENNMIIANPTTPAQLFHLLRRHLLLRELRPLIIFTPKAYLRHPDCTSQLTDFEQLAFAEIIDDPLSPKKAARLAFCSGKMYYEVDALRKKQQLKDLAVIRIEQLYPLHTERLIELMKIYSEVNQFIWIQEEPSNMGAWSFIQPILRNIAGADISYIGRKRSASPGTGSHALHEEEDARIIDQIVNAKVE